MCDLSFTEWKRLITSSESDDRSHAADQMPKGGPQKEIVRLLVECLNDEDALVRTCAADTLGMYPTEEARVALRAAIDREEDELAKAYALSSLGAVGTLQDIGRLVEALRTETDPRVRIDAALGLAFCALSESVEQLLTHVRQRGHHQVAGANCLHQYLNSHRGYVKLIRYTVKKQQEKKDLEVHEKEALANLLAVIEENYKL